jgi:DNA recombination-dependent growth factor C
MKICLIGKWVDENHCDQTFTVKIESEFKGAIKEVADTILKLHTSNIHHIDIMESNDVNNIYKKL